MRHFQTRGRDWFVDWLIDWLREKNDFYSTSRKQVTDCYLQTETPALPHKYTGEKKTEKTEKMKKITGQQPPPHTSPSEASARYTGGEEGRREIHKETRERWR